MMSQRRPLGSRSCREAAKTFLIRLREISSSMATVSMPLRIGLADHGRRMTLDEFLEAEVEEGYRYELARGVLEVTQVPNDPHFQVVTNLYLAIAMYFRAHPGVILRFGGGS